MATIIKKIDKQWLDLILAGKKKFELRLADFDIEEGDTLRLEEWTVPDSDGKREFTGRFVEKTVTYAPKIDLKTWIENQPELVNKGFCVLQFD